MNSISSIENLLNQIKQLNLSSLEMHNFINSLNQEEYASIATIFSIGRSGWDRTSYIDTTEYYSFIEEYESYGEAVNDEILDRKFLTTTFKRNQIETDYYLSLKELHRSDNEYNHNWLSWKPNLIDDIEKGLYMLKEVY